MAASTAQPLYPHFADRYWQRDGLDASPAPPGAPGAPRDPALSPSKAAARMGNLRVLDLRALPRDDGPPTELRARKEKLALFNGQCSRVAEGLYVGGEAVARSREALAAAGITHVVNCVGFLYPPYHEPELAYQTLFLQDTPGEDILCVLYDVFDFIEAATCGAGGGAEGASPGRVLVHCSQGVSRSASLAIAYLMWKRGTPYDDAFLEVKASRGVANPNIGFICQLLQWYKRRQASADAWRLYRITPQSAAAPQQLVAKPVAAAGLGAALDRRGAFVLQGPGSVAVWLGALCPEPFAAAAQRFAAQLHRYEGAPTPAEVVQQGQEGEAFWAQLAQAAAAGEGAGSRSASPAAPASSGGAAAAAAEMLAAAGGGPVVVGENSAYDRDFELYARSLTARTSGSGGDSARSAGRKTPREHGDGATSPNERLRKQARGEARPPSPGKRRREPPSDLTLEDLQCVSMDSAAAQMVKKERTLQEATSPSPLGRTTSDVMLPATPHDLSDMADGSATPRSRGGEAASWEAAGRQGGGGGCEARRPCQPSNLGRQASAVSTSGPAGAVAPEAAAAAGGQGAGNSGRSKVPPLRLALPGRKE